MSRATNGNSLLTPTVCLLFFFFNDTATTEIYTLSLHDALPIRAGTGRNRRGGPMSRPGWNTARCELTVAGLVALALTAAAWALDGPPLAGFVLLTCVALSLVTLRALIEPREEPAPPEASHELGPSRSFLGFWRTRSDLVDATRSLGAWDH